MTNCAGCNREVELVEPSTWLCQKCYSARLDAQRAREEERSAIVAWLELQRKRLEDSIDELCDGGDEVTGFETGQFFAFDQALRVITRGEHHV